ncbi:MAG: hypothetical protein HS123_15710 [Solibacteraceae bacterium]|nr:hypothetical protein [Solibacteraceae bacterium]
MIKNMASAFALTAFLGVGALAQYAEVTRWYDVQPDQGKITFYVMMNGVGTYPEYNETCFQLLTDPGGRQWYSGTTGVNFALCSQDAFYEAYQEAGTYEVETTAYAVPYQGYPPFVPFNYDLGPKVQVVIQPWLKLDPGGWSPATAATAGGVSHLMAQVTTSRGCSGTVKLDAAYSFPPGLKTVSTPTSHVQGSVNEIK